jgi:hypothetical protein
MRPCDAEGQGPERSTPLEQVLQFLAETTSSWPIIFHLARFFHACAERL